MVKAPTLATFDLSSEWKASVARLWLQCLVWLYLLFLFICRLEPLQGSAPVEGDASVR